MNENSKSPKTIPVTRRAIPLTPEQVQQLSPAKKAMLKAAASGKPVIIRR